MVVYKKALDKEMPLKQKYIRANNGRFMNKDITKSIMKRTKVKEQLPKK